MRKIFAITVLLFLAQVEVFAQMDESIKPKSFELAYSNLKVSELVLPAFDSAEAAHLDLNDSKNGKLPLFSRNIKCHVSLASNDFTETLPATNDNGRIKQKQITSKGALGLVVLFDKLYLPEGATLHVYSPDRKQVLGAFTHSNTPSPIAFNAGIIAGESCIIEYYEPFEQFGKSILAITEIGHAYRWVKDIEDLTGVNASGACEVNVACSEATNWQNQKRAVARILVVANGGQGYCSGALVNTVRQDCTPYFLTAQHCSEGATTAQYNQWVFYFNYEASTCSGTTGPQNKTITGCSKIADSNDNGGATGSDFLLLQLSNAPPTSYNVFYSGWNSTNTASSTGICIHHPDGDIKKISSYTQAPTSTEWGNTAQNTHWSVKWAATANGHGVTEPGSSGAPLFNNQGFIIGTLTGGNSFCSSPNSPDQFGKLSYHWVSNGSANNRRLKPWLDPDNTGTISLDGTNAPCGSTVQNDAGIQAINAPQGSICNLSLTPSVVLRNYGGNVLQSVVINYQIDGNVYQYTWNGNLPAGSSVTVTLNTVNLTPGSHTFTAETNAPNGANDNNTSNDILSTSFAAIPPNDVLNLYLRTDSYGSETTWTIEDVNNNEVAGGGPYGNVNGGEILNIPVCIAPGCYTLKIKDSYGDGMNDGGASDFALTGNGGAPEYATLSNRNFGYTESHNFCIAGTGVIEADKVQVKVVPNPSSGMFTLSFSDDRQYDIHVIDAIGRLVLNSQVSGRGQIDLSEQPKGIYILQAQTKTGRLTSKLVVE
ncbi:MAG TPA: T9SS type A sorting domain-containing protein [Chitinophagales bacterium]|nr:T9SS type A sorting domain-containing protein [Chitinophagales bacterium]